MPECLRVDHSRGYRLFAAAPAARAGLPSRASSLYLWRVFGQLFLILLRPGVGLFDYVFEYLCDHDFSLSKCLHCRTSRFGDMHAMKGPYSTERSVALMIARELLNEIVSRDTQTKLPG